MKPVKTGVTSTIGKAGQEFQLTRDGSTARKTQCSMAVMSNKDNTLPSDGRAGNRNQSRLGESVAQASEEDGIPSSFGGNDGAGQNIELMVLVNHQPLDGKGSVYEYGLLRMGGGTSSKERSRLGNTCDGVAYWYASENMVKLQATWPKSQSFESIGRFVHDSCVFGKLVKRNLPVICPIDYFARQALTSESIRRQTPLLNIHGNLCDTCVVVLIASQRSVGIIEHLLHRDKGNRG